MAHLERLQEAHGRLGFDSREPLQKSSLDAPSGVEVKEFLRLIWLIAFNCVVLGVAEGNMAHLLFILIAKRVMLKKFNQVVCSIAWLAASRRSMSTLRVRSPGMSESLHSRSLVFNSYFINTCGRGKRYAKRVYWPICRLA